MLYLIKSLSLTLPLQLLLPKFFTRARKAAAEDGRHDGSIRMPGEESRLDSQTASETEISNLSELGRTDLPDLINPDQMSLD